MQKLRLGELCAGYGGLGMAVEDVFNADTAWFSEFDDAPSKILAHHWPGVPNYGDMTAIDWAAIEPVDIISGGTPCQDLSAAGARKGMTEGTRSNLWVQMREAIAIQQPAYVVWENVRGAFSAEASSSVEQCPGCVGDTSDGRVFLRALGRVLGDLSDLGYDCQWRGLRASDVGACHARFRVFVLAAHSDHPGRGEQRRAFAVQPEHAAAEYPRSDAADTQGAGLGRITGDLQAAHGSFAEEGRPERRADRDAARREGSGDNATADAESIGWGERRAESTRVVGGSTATSDSSPVTEWGDYAPAIARWESVMGRRAPAPTDPTGRDGGQRLSPRFTEWMMGLPEGWVTDPAIGITRNDMLKACGNGVVPQQAVAALRDMLAAFNAGRETVQEAA